MHGKGFKEDRGRAACLRERVSAFVRSAAKVSPGEKRRGVLVLRGCSVERGEWGWNDGGGSRNEGLCTCGREVRGMFRAVMRRSPFSRRSAIELGAD